MPKLNRFYVYVFFRPWNGIPCYVGKGSGRRATRPSRRLNPHLERIIEKAAGASLPVVIVRAGITEAEAFETEIALIKAIGRGHRGPLANLTDGGEGTSGWIAPPDFCAKVSVRLKGHKFNLGRKQSSEEIEKRRKAITGRKRSPESKERMRIAQLGNKKGIGHTVSPEAKAATSVRFKGVPLTLEHCEKLRQAKLGKPGNHRIPHTKETKAKISASKRKAKA
jgi:hypothetical protein